MLKSDLLDNCFDEQEHYARTYTQAQTHKSLLQDLLAEDIHQCSQFASPESNAWFARLSATWFSSRGIHLTEKESNFLAIVIASWWSGIRCGCFTLHVPSIWLTTSMESDFMQTLLAPSERAIRIPSRRPFHSATLLVALPICRATLCTFCPLSSSTQTPKLANPGLPRAAPSMLICSSSNLRIGAPAGTAAFFSSESISTFVLFALITAAFFVRVTVLGAAVFAFDFDPILGTETLPPSTGSSFP
mmetsp:Transcript_32363/g.50417  ORF Transcript_32363/g.50417 Transcript_32363/m.50417 type:complete len:246 (-) Transcript_32363:158-895(-)